MVDLKTFGVKGGGGQHHEEIIYSLALLYNIVSNEVASYLKDYDLTAGKLNILIAVKHQGGQIGIKQVEISKHLIVTPSNMTKMLDKLEQQRLVCRYALEGDRRVNMVKITAKGDALLDSIWEGYNDQLKRLVGVISREEQKQLAGLLLGWLENAG